MDKSYIKSEKGATKIGLWVLFFNTLMIFIWLLYETYETFNILNKLKMLDQNLKLQIYQY